MPNKIKRYKRSVAVTGHTHMSTTRKGASVKALLERLPIPALARIADQNSAQYRWKRWLARHLPEGLFAHVSGIVERDGILTVFTESAVWSARARLALGELEGKLHAEEPSLRSIAVKVMPRALKRST